MNAQAQALRTALVTAQKRTKELERGAKQHEEDHARLTVCMLQNVATGMLTAA